MKIVKNAEITLLSDEIFILEREKVYLGIFKKHKDKVFLISPKLILLPKNLVTQFSKQSIISFFLFKHRDLKNKLLINVTKEENKINFKCFLFSLNNLDVIESFVNVDNEFLSVFDPNEMANLFIKGVKNVKKMYEIFETIIPEEIKEILPKAGSIFLHLDDDLDFLPFEILYYKYLILVKRKLKPLRRRVERKGSEKVYALFGNSWVGLDKTVVEVEYISEILANKGLKFETFLTKVDLFDFINTLNTSDFVFISSHADENGIDFGGFVLNESLISSLSKVPRYVFVNTCYSGSVVKFACDFVKKGTYRFLISGYRVPDSYVTANFSRRFFECFTSGMNFDDSLVLSILNNKYSKFFNYVGYRLYC